MKNVLIVSTPTDAHVQAVEWSLRSAGHNVCVWNTRKALQDDGFAAEFSFSSPSTLTMHNHVAFDAGWVRRVFKANTFNESTDESDKEFLTSESSFFVDNSLELMSRKPMFWLSDFPKTLRAEYKFNQLDACQILGIRFPETLVTNSPKRIRAFCERQGKVAVKPINVYTWEESDGGQLMSYTNTLTTDQMSRISDEELLMCPAIYQEYVDKKLELRVVCVGSEVFTCAIENPNTECIDFRLYQTDGSLKKYYFETPDTVRLAILQLCDFFGLQLASSDFCIDYSGNIYFLDLNPGGAFLFVEACSEGKNRIVAKIASLLTSGNADDFPSLTEFLAYEQERVKDSVAV
ncbi:MAG: hypothetical protein WC736_16395 [Gallionella sp.]|jgi:hypothetical protein